MSQLEHKTRFWSVMNILQQVVATLDHGCQRLRHMDDPMGRSANDHSNIRRVAFRLVAPRSVVRFSDCSVVAETSGEPTAAAASRTRAASPAARATLGSL